MSVTIEQLRHIAKLSRLNFTDDELMEFSGDFNKIVEYIDTLNEANTEGVEPLAYPVPHEVNLREDVEKKSITREEALKNAPDSDEEFFRVPKVIS